MKHTKPTAASIVKAVAPVGLRGVSEVSEAKLPTFSYRTASCDAHDTATATSCSECVRGEVDCQCADCLRVAPLNDDGLCRYCDDSRELSTVQMQAKWLCPNVLRNPETRVEL